MSFKNPQLVTEEEAKAYFVVRAARIEGGLKCLSCGQPGATVQGQNTRYHEDIRNWTCLCDECAKENEAHWADMWADYYANCM